MEVELHNPNYNEERKDLDMTNIFRKAQRSQAKLRLAIIGPAGSGKTMSSILIAKGLCGENANIAMIDTENGSGDLYSDLNYDVATLKPPFTPQSYLTAITEAEKAGYDICIIDSLTHAWAGEGGLLEMHDNATKATRNSFTAWKEITPHHTRLVNKMIQASIHVIATVRTKTAYEIQEVNGKKVPIKLGLSPVFRDGIEYEFTTVFDLSVDGHVATVSKDRTGIFDSTHFVPSIKTGVEFAKWLNTATPNSLPKNNNGWAEELWKSFKIVPDAKSFWKQYANEAGLEQGTLNANDKQIEDLKDRINRHIAAYMEKNK